MLSKHKETTIIDLESTKSSSKTQKKTKKEEKTEKKYEKIPPLQHFLTSWPIYGVRVSSLEAGPGTSLYARGMRLGQIWIILNYSQLSHYWSKSSQKHPSSNEISYSSITIHICPWVPALLQMSVQRAAVGGENRPVWSVHERMVPPAKRQLVSTGKDNRFHDNQLLPEWVTQGAGNCLCVYFGDCGAFGQAGLA